MGAVMRALVRRRQEKEVVSLCVRVGGVGEDLTVKTTPLAHAYTSLVYLCLQRLNSLTKRRKRKWYACLML